MLALDLIHTYQKGTFIEPGKTVKSQKLPCWRQLVFSFIFLTVFSSSSRVPAINILLRSAVLNTMIDSSVDNTSLN